jgi:hypothetical protein
MSNTKTDSIELKTRAGIEIEQGITNVYIHLKISNVGSFSSSIPIAKGETKQAAIEEAIRILDLTLKLLSSL